MTDKEGNNLKKIQAIKTSVVPWLSVQNSKSASDFYKSALGAVEVYRLETPGGGLVVRLSVDGAEFWISGEMSDGENTKNESVGGETVRMILTVADPEPVFAKALEAGAIEIFPVGEDYGWKLGRLVDPFGLHWEIGHQLPDDQAGL